MTTYECRTQTELDQALTKAGPCDIVACVGAGDFTIRGSSRVVAWGSSSVVARESSSVVANDNTTINHYGSKIPSVSGYSVLIDRRKTPPQIICSWQKELVADNV